MDKWLKVQLFVQTAELGSVSKASEALGLSSSAGGAGISRIWNTYQNRKYMSSKVRALIDFLIENFDKMEYERRWTQTWSHR